MIDKHHRNSRRRASMIMEAVVAFALLSAAAASLSVLVVSVQRSRAVHRRALASRMLAEAVGQQMLVVPYDELTAAAERTGDERTHIHVELAPAEVAGVSGMRITVAAGRPGEPADGSSSTAARSERPQVVTLWRFPPMAVSQGETPDSETLDSEAAQ